MKSKGKPKHFAANQGVLPLDFAGQSPKAPSLSPEVWTFLPRCGSGNLQLYAATQEVTCTIERTTKVGKGWWDGNTSADLHILETWHIPIPSHVSMCACGMFTSLRSQWLFHPRRRRKLCSSPAVKRVESSWRSTAIPTLIRCTTCRSHFQVPKTTSAKLQISWKPQTKVTCLPDWQTRDVLTIEEQSRQVHFKIHIALPGFIGDFTCEQ